MEAVLVREPGYTANIWPPPVGDFVIETANVDHLALTQGSNWVIV
jgi:hypothetical protein